MSRYDKPLMEMNVSLPTTTAIRYDEEALEKGISRSEYILSLLIIADPTILEEMGNKQIKKSRVVLRKKGDKHRSSKRKERALIRASMGMDRSHYLTKSQIGGYLSKNNKP